MDPVLAALQWDPHIRGALIVLTGIIVLCGSVYMLLATNMGARIGFVLALAGLMGWMTIMGVVWTVFGIGLKGAAPHWVIEEAVTGDLSLATSEVLADFPRTWKKLPPGDKVLADAQTAADHVLAPGAAEAEGGGHGGEGGGAEAGGVEDVRFDSPFRQPTDYVQVAGYHRGGDNELFTIGRHKFYFRHSPHYAVVQVQPVLKQPPPQPGTPAQPPGPDPSKPVTTVVMLRDLGNLRFPPFLVTLFSGIIFAVCCYVLHQRDKEIMRMRAARAGTA